MLEGEANCGTGAARCAPANGIHNHQHGPTIWSKKLVHVRGSPRFFNAVLSEIAPHRGNELFRVGHDVILHRESKISALAGGSQASNMSPDIIADSDTANGVAQRWAYNVKKTFQGGCLVRNRARR